MTASANLRNLDAITDTDIDNVAFTLIASSKGEDFYAAESIFDFKLDSLTSDTHKYEKLEMIGKVTKGPLKQKLLHSTKISFLILALQENTLITT